MSLDENKTSKERGKFNLSYEETVLLRSRNSLLRRALDTIYNKTRYVISSAAERLNEREIDVLREIVETSREGKRREDV